MNVLITGTSSGFGKEASEMLAERGHTVVATMRNTEGKNKEAADQLSALDHIHVVEMDVSDDRSVNQGVAAAIEKAGGLDVVINNAGIMNMGVTETFTAADVSTIFDVNTIGPVRVINAILPHLREKQSGLIINISSIVGALPMPFTGAYSGTKAALEVISDDYAATLAGSGIESVVLEPGGFPTTQLQANFVQPSNGDLMAAYPAAQAVLEGFGESLGELFKDGTPDTNDVSKALVELIESPAGTRPARTVVDPLSADVVRKYHQQKSALSAQFVALYSGQDQTVAA
jgi:NAD(P)-dependent dehydrogenase (short-subunit alcohol dehydrogenase family)